MYVNTLTSCRTHTKLSYKVIVLIMLTAVGFIFIVVGGRANGGCLHFVFNLKCIESELYAVVPYCLIYS